MFLRNYDSLTICVLVWKIKSLGFFVLIRCWYYMLLLLMNHGTFSLLVVSVLCVTCLSVISRMDHHLFVQAI